MATITTGTAAAASELVAGPEHASLFARSARLSAVQLDTYVDGDGEQHVLLAVFGHNEQPPPRWRVFDAVLVDESAALEPLEHAAAIAAVYVTEQEDRSR